MGKLVSATEVITKPIVTVLMPVYNGEYFLQNALNSIFNQKFRNLELLVINDASTDGTNSILLNQTDKRLRILNNPRNIGVAASLNRGLKEAHSKYIARMDADDISLPNRLMLQVEYLESHPSTALIGGNYRLIDESDSLISKPAYNHSMAGPELAWRLLWKNCIAHPTVLFRRQAVLAAGCYPENSPHSEDYGLWLRLSRTMRLATSKKVVLYLRKHKTNITTIHAEQSEKNALSSSVASIRSFLDIEPKNTLLEQLRFPGKSESNTELKLAAIHYLNEVAKKFLENSIENLEEKNLRQAIAEQFLSLSHTWRDNPVLTSLSQQYSIKYNPCITLNIFFDRIQKKLFN